MSNKHAVTIYFSGPVEPARKILYTLDHYTLLPGSETTGLGDNLISAANGLHQWGLQYRWSDSTWGSIPDELFKTLNRKKHEMDSCGLICERITKSVHDDYGIARTLLKKRDAALLAELGAEFATDLSVADEENFVCQFHPLLPTTPGYRIVIGIDFYGFDTSPDLITHRLGIEPSSEWRAEDVDSQGKLREKNRWYSYVESEDMTVEELVIEYLDHISPLFDEIEAMGLRDFAELRIGAFQTYPDNDTSTVVLSPKALQAVAQANFDLSVSLYFSAPGN